MATIELRSKANDQHVYAISPAPLNEFRSWDYTDKAISPRVCWADCMNDYPTRHTPYGVATSDMLEDFLHVLALYLKDNGANPAILDFWPRQPAETTILRLHEVKHTEGKDTYYNPSTGETSKAQKYKNDNRWRLVPTWATGANTAAQCYGLFAHGWHNSLYQLIWMRKAWRVLPAGSGPMVDPQFIPETLRGREQPLMRLLDACQSYVDAFRLKTSADNDLEAYQEHYAKK